MKVGNGYSNKTFALTLLAVSLALPGAWAQDNERFGNNGKGNKHGQRAEAENMRLVGFNDLQARSAYQPTIQNQGGRFIAYVGHHGGSALNPLTGVVESNGTSIVDVTNPRNPQYLHHIPGPSGAGEAGGAQMTRVCSGADLPNADDSKFYLLRTSGNEGHEIYDVTDPANPVLVTTVVQGLQGTHKNFWECNTGIAYLVSGVPGWRTNRMTQIFDLSDPANPVFIRDFGLPGQEPGSTGDVPIGLHGPISLGNRVYFGYGTSSNGILQIVDRELLLTGDPAPTPENLVAPQIARYEIGDLDGAHTVLPLLNMEIPEFRDFTRGSTRDMIALVNESTANECREAPQMMYMVDITTETEPHGVSNYHVKESEGDFCQRGGRFGAHSSHENLNNPYGNKVVFLAYFNAGIRAVDVRNPWSPRELGYYIPRVNENTEERCVTTDGVETCKTAIQTNNLEVDDRGYIYAVDRANSGMHIVELTSRAKRTLERDPR